MRIRHLAAPVLALALVLPTQTAPATAAPLTGTPGTSVSSAASEAQRALLDETNRYRTSRGLAPFTSLGALDDLAQSWSETMAREGAMKHNPRSLDSYPPAWRGAAENVGTYSREVPARDMLRAWIDSPSHRANLDNPEFTHLGVGWAVNARGELYATQNFARF